MENVQNNVVATVKPKSKLTLKKVITSACAGAMAVSMVAVNAFAEETGASSANFNYSSIADTMSEAFTAAGDGIVMIFGAVLPIGLGIMAMYAMVGAGKKIFTKLTG